MINGTDNITDEVDAVKSKVSGNQNNRRNRNTSSTSTTDEYGPGETTVVPANKQVAGTFQTPLTDLFKSANSTSLDAPNRESNLTSIVNKVNKWLAEDQTGALTQCITIAAKPLALAKILRDVYRNKITKEDTYIEYYVTDYIDDCQEQTCPNIYTSVHNRACGNPINEVTQGGTCAKAIEKMQNTLCTNESKYWEWPPEINNDCKKQLSNACRALVNAHCEVAIKTANPETPARILNKNQAPFNCTVTH